MTRRRLLAPTLSLVLGLDSAALGGEAAGPETHAGIAMALDQDSLSMRDAESAKNPTFIATR